MQKVRIQQGDQIFKFLNIEHHDHKDGTLIIVFNRAFPTLKKMHFTTLPGSIASAMHVERNKFQITYHSSGRINFHGGGGPPVFCEPPHRIT